MKSFKGWVRFLFVTVGIVALTSFTVDATDALRGSQSALSILMGSALEDSCPEGTVQIDLSDKSICMDMYENSVADTCPVTTPENTLQTKENIDVYTCTSESKVNETPWVFVSYTQAKQLCAKKNMRLPSPLEWYESGLGTPDSQACNTKGTLADTGVFSECISSRGVYDTIGNVWEWVDTKIESSVFEHRTLPSEGYVTEVGTAGVATVTSRESNNLYNNDYFWTGTEGTRAMLRGGFYAAGDDAGLFAVNTTVTPAFSSIAIGFRCVQNL